MDMETEHRLIRLAAEAKRRGDTATYEAVLGRLTGALPEAPSGFMRGLRDYADAPAQMLERVLPESWATSLNQASNAMGLAPVAETPTGGQEQVANLEAEYQRARAAAGEKGIDWARMGGNIAGGLGLTTLAALAGVPGMAGAGAAGLGVLGRTLMSTLGGAAAAPLMTPTTEIGERFWPAKGEQALQGGIGGTAGGLVLAGLGRAGANARRPAVRELQSEGVVPTPGQLLGPMASSVEEKLMSAPGGEIIANARRDALEQFDTAMMNRALAPISGRVQGTGPDAVADMQAQGSAAFNAAKNLLPGGLTMDAQATREMNALAGDLAYASKGAEDDFTRFIGNLSNRKISPAGAMSADDFRFIESKLSEKINGTADGELRNIYLRMRRTLQDMAARQAPDYAESLKDARTAWAGIKRVERASTAAPSQLGIFTPAQVLAAEKAASKDKSGFAAGRGLLQDFATAGHDVLGNKVPDSGTAGRWNTVGAAAGLGAAASQWPEAVATALAGVASLSALYSPAGRKAAAAALQRSPDLPPEVAAILAGAAAGG